MTGREAATLNKLMEFIGRIYLMQDRAWEDISMIVIRSTNGADEPASPSSPWVAAKGVLEYQGTIAPPYRGTLVLRLWRDDWEQWIKGLSPHDRDCLWRLCEDWIKTSSRACDPAPIYLRSTNGDHRYSDKRALPAWISEYQLGIVKQCLAYSCTVRWIES